MILSLENERERERERQRQKERDKLFPTYFVDLSNKTTFYTRFENSLSPPKPVKKKKKKTFHDFFQLILVLLYIRKLMFMPVHYDVSKKLQLYN